MLLIGSCISLVHRSVARACATLGTLDQRMVDAVEARQEVDLRIGSEKSFLYSLHIYVFL